MFNIDKIIIKDIIVLVLMILWLTTNIIEVLMTGQVFLGNIIFIVLLCVMLLFKLNNSKFNDWLNKVVYKREKP